jgi:FtsH-binding integral membrane protein
LAKLGALKLALSGISIIILLLIGLIIASVRVPVQLLVFLTAAEFALGIIAYVLRDMDQVKKRAISEGR